ncbi:MAG: SDR family NAD(P)-dependent oxidoreductase [Candidatus Limnocylindria bacterium]
MQLSGKKAVVTGGGRGIGRAIALALAREGADLAVVYTRNREDAQAVVDEACALGRDAIAIHADVSVLRDVRSVVEQAAGRFGRIDVLVNNAGMVSRAPFLDMEELDFDRIVAVDLKGPFLVAQAVSQRMVADSGGGSIINITSISAERAYPGLVHYQAAKAGVAMLTKGMALELAPHRIRVNAIAPGLTATDINRDLRDGRPDLWQQRVARVPLGRPGTPDDHVGAAVFLASDASAWISGATIVVDGGQLVL